MPERLLPELVNELEELAAEETGPPGFTLDDVAEAEDIGPPGLLEVIAGEDSGPPGCTESDVL